MAAPMNGPNQKIHCPKPKGNKLQFFFKQRYKSLEEFGEKIYMMIPGLGFVIDHCSAEASSRVDAGAGDGNGG